MEIERDRAKSAQHLAKLALSGEGSGSAAAARLLLSLQFNEPFNLQDLIRLDSVNRAHAETVILGIEPSDIWPAAWFENGSDILNQIKAEWS